MTMDKITEFLGWLTVINMGLLIFSSIMIIALRDKIIAIHSKLLNLNANDLNKAYFQFLAQYKILILIFNLVPYVALKIIF